MGFLSGLFGPPSPDRFAKMMISELRRIGVQGDIHYDSEAFTLTLAGSTGYSLFLGNALADYGKVSRKERQGILERYASHVLADDESETFEDVRPNLLPRIRERVFYEANRLRFWKPGEEPPKMQHRVFSEHLALSVVIDYPTRIKEAWQDPTEAWGVTFEEEVQIATDNLWERSKERFQELIPGLWQSPWRDNHDASRLCLHNLVRTLRVKGDIVAMVPNRDTLLVTGSEDVDGLTLMAAVGEKEFEDNRAISGIPVTLDGSTWSPFLVSPGHPAFDALNLLRYQTLLRDHADQKSARDEWNEKHGVDLFVATFQVFEKPKKGGLHSIGTWTQGVPTLLPVTDSVALLRIGPNDEPAGDLVQVPWDRALSVVGHRMKAQEMYPPRYLVEDFPSEAELAELARS